MIRILLAAGLLLTACLHPAAEPDLSNRISHYDQGNGVICYMLDHRFDTFSCVKVK